MFESNIEKLANKNYKTIIEKVWNDDEGEYYFIAYNEEFGKYSCRGVGKTADEALEDLKSERYDLIAILLEKGKSIPEPISSDEEINVSGKFLVRTSPIVHHRLLVEAKKMNISFNLLVNQLLTHNLTCFELQQFVDQRITSAENKIDRNFQEIKSIQKYEIEEEALSLEGENNKLGLYRAEKKVLEYGIGG